MPPSGDTHIHDPLPYLSQPGQIFKIYNFRDTCIPDLLGERSTQIFSETCLEREQAQNRLMKIALDKNLQKDIWVALDEGSEIFMVAEKNRYYQIKFTEKQLPRDIQWTYSDDLKVILIDSLDESDRKQGGWLNPPPVRGGQPMILIPCLGEKFRRCDILES
ncbi:hypothetical protein PENARI_c105G00331 [Penicillium arizonense]|uniref:Uncharacterized protein n=1 Tax=Penicillium arizonense TaxID=1835702 RepID=A0A1F5L0U3_PENAI|nr:hypothetical protein PENARI_c105G00331 [Penicillium arizonense]OGE46814.1 hypothetical protein PENARI_c105G00331 [Penicillium arizonense]